MKRRIHFNALFLAAVWAKCTFEIFLSYLRQQCGACSSCSSPSPSSPPSPPSSFPFASPPQIPLSSRFFEFCFHSPHSPPSLDAFLLFLLFSCSPPPALLLPPAGRSWSGGWRQFRKRKTQTFFPWRDLVLNSAFSLSLHKGDGFTCTTLPHNISPIAPLLSWNWKIIAPKKSTQVKFYFVNIFGVQSGVTAEEGDLVSL